MWHNSSLESIADTLKIKDVNGLTATEAAQRLKDYGRNQIRHEQHRSPILLFLEQFKNAFMLLMLGAAALSFLLQSWRDGIILLLVVLLNAVVGFYQDWKSENILASLRQLVVEKCYVLRDGIKVEIPGEELVPGDLVFLEEGDGVPADIRLLEANGLSANEFILTGESQPSEKLHDIQLPENLPLAGRTNCLFMGTTIAKGEGKGLVVATGMSAELGKIATESLAIDASATPLQRELDMVGKRITLVTVVLAAVMLAGRLLIGEPIEAAVIFAIGVAAAMVPEGLPAQISVSLALGVGRLAKKKAVVKKMSAVEALGAATVIASDKTGTITKNEMTIIHAWLNGRNFTITGTGYEPVGEVFDVDGNVVTKENLADEKVFFLNGFLGSTGKVNPPDTHHPHWYPVGDPTEAAFATLLLKTGHDTDEIERQYPRLRLFPFDSYRKRMSILRQHNDKTIAFIKGSIESVLQICDQTILDGEVRPLTQTQKKDFIEAAKVQAAEAHRIIALAYKDLPDGTEVDRLDTADVENNAVFAGFATMIDPPHEEVASAIQKAYKAGVKVLMITGDNEITARAVANQIGMATATGALPAIVNDQQLQAMSDADLIKVLGARSVIFSRASPSDKLRIVSLLREQGDIVAVTGDGVNDTLSLKKADVGVAMGQRGSRVAQEASSMVLLDDNFSTIVHAIEQGRNIYTNLKKITLANLNGNVAELTCILIGFAGAFWGYPLALLPVHILLIDLIGNMLPLLAVTFDPPEEDLMSQPPRKLGSLLTARNFAILSANGVLKGLLSFAACALTYELHAGEALQHERAVTVTLTALIVLQFVNIFTGRTAKSVFGPYFFSNPKLFLGMGSSLIFIGIISYLPFLNPLLHTAPLHLMDWAAVGVAAVLYLGALEVAKYARTSVQAVKK